MSPVRPLITSPDEPAARAVRRVLSHLAMTIETNSRGIVDDLGTEHLHDLRVATRRTRTALGELKGALPKKAAAPFRAEFKWLGMITGPCRDHDVWVEDLSKEQTLESTMSNIDVRAVVHLARQRRQLVWFTLKTHLQSPRFQQLLTTWRGFLQAVAEETAKHSDSPVGELATRTILKAHNRLVRRRSEILNAPPDEVLHRTRIDAKKLRYLLEFFSGLYSDSAVGTVIRRLRDLQNDLGRFNDCAVQRGLLAELRSRIVIDQTGDDPTLNTIDALDRHIEARQASCRAPFRKHFSAFTNKVATQSLREL